jgi:hypothetical protein
MSGPDMGCRCGERAGWNRQGASATKGGVEGGNQKVIECD